MPGTRHKDQLSLYETAAGDAEREWGLEWPTCQMQAEAEAASNQKTPEEMCRDIKN